MVNELHSGSVMEGPCNFSRQSRSAQSSSVPKTTSSDACTVNLFTRSPRHPISTASGHVWPRASIRRPMPHTGRVDDVTWANRQEGLSADSYHFCDKEVIRLFHPSFLRGILPPQRSQTSCHVLISLPTRYCPSQLKTPYLRLSITHRETVPDPIIRNQ